MPQPSRFRVATLVPFVPVLAGIALSAWRFRAGDSLGGLALGLAGMLGMIVLALRVTDPE